MNLFTFDYNFPNISLKIHLLVVIIILVLVLLDSEKVRSYLNLFNFNQNMLIDEKSLGIGSNFIKFKPNNKDKEIAYKLWVELSTRKLGIPLDMENDVIYEVYKSWYEFFKITRSTLKEFPVSKLQNNNSNKIIDITIRVLNGRLRNHLTKWQSKYNRWYEFELENNASNISPQDIQKNFPEYDELVDDLKKVNDELMYYVSVLYNIVFSNEE